MLCLVTIIHVNLHRLLLELEATLFEVNVKVLLNNVGRLRPTYRARGVDHTIRAARAFHGVLIFEFTSGRVIEPAFETFRLRDCVLLERLTLGSLLLRYNRLRLLYLWKVNCNGRVRRPAFTVVRRSPLLVHLAPVQPISVVVYEWHLRAIRFALLHALPCPRRLDLLLRRRRYVTLAQKVVCVIVDRRALVSALLYIEVLV